MRLGIAYNVFDGEELLEASIRSVRRNADFIVTVAQEISNYGNRCDEGLRGLLSSLLARGLLNKVVWYEPDLSKPAHINETAKRNVGLEECKQAGMTHFLSMDVDEFYVEEELEYAKHIVERGNYDGSACRLYVYVKRPTYRVEALEDYFISLIYTISDKRFEPIDDKKFHVYCDPTRRMQSKRFKIFRPEEIVMHHMSYVRKDLRRKLENSSSRARLKNIDGIVAEVEGYSLGKKLSDGRECREVPNLFNVAEDWVL